MRVRRHVHAELRRRDVAPAKVLRSEAAELHAVTDAQDGDAELEETLFTRLADAVG